MDPDKSSELDDLTQRLLDSLNCTASPGKKPLPNIGGNTDKNPTSGPDKSQDDDDDKLGVCGKCSGDVRGEATVVKGLHYHPNCFTCDECFKPIGSQKYFVINGKKICQNDKNKHLDKCGKCGLVIEEKAIRTQGSDEVFHADCFTCAKCGIVLHGKFFNLDNDRLCEDDFLKTREKCHRCSQPIMESSLRALERIYHPECFRCSMCPKTLEGTQFFITNDTKEPVCKEDFERFVAMCCDGCKEPIVAERYVSLSTGENFHQKCYNAQNR